MWKNFEYKEFKIKAGTEFSFRLFYEVVLKKLVDPIHEGAE